MRVRSLVACVLLVIFVVLLVAVPVAEAHQDDSGRRVQHGNKWFWRWWKQPWKWLRNWEEPDVGRDCVDPNDSPPCTGNIVAWKWSGLGRLLAPPIDPPKKSPKGKNCRKKSGGCKVKYDDTDSGEIGPPTTSAT